MRKIDESSRVMKNIEIKSIVTNTLTEFAADADKQIIDPQTNAADSWPVEFIICSQCGQKMPADAYARTFGRCAKHADGE